MHGTLFLHFGAPRDLAWRAVVQCHPSTWSALPGRHRPRAPPAAAACCTGRPMSSAWSWCLTAITMPVYGARVCGAAGDGRSACRDSRSGSCTRWPRGSTASPWAAPPSRTSSRAICISRGTTEPKRPVGSRVRNPRTTTHKSQRTSARRAHLRGRGCGDLPQRCHPAWTRVLASGYWTRARAALAPPPAPGV